MKIKVDNGTLTLAALRDDEYQAVRSWGSMKWNKTMKWMEGDCTLDALEKLSELVPLPDNAEEEYQKLKAVQDAIDTERNNSDPVPLYKYPVKANLYRHQIRGCNMALIAFGVINPEGTAGDGYKRINERIQQDDRPL